MAAGGLYPSARMLHPVNIGDPVAFTDSYLDRQSRFYPDMRSATGEVTALHQLESNDILADVEWDTPYLPKRVNVKNLVRANIASGP